MGGRARVFRWRLPARLQQLRWKLVAVFTALAIPPLLAAAGYLLVVLPRELDNDALEALRLRQRAGLDLVERHLAGVTEDVRVLGRLEPVVQLAGGDEGALSVVRAHFLLVAEEHPNYLQVRLLDGRGVELVRVNRAPGGAVTAVAEEDLQDKSDRYYVEAAIRLDAGQVYVSPIDLNRERRALEVPYQPVIRYAMRAVAPGGRASGLVVINVDASGLLADLAALSGGGDPGDIVLLDSEGYVVLHPDPALAWSSPRDLDTGHNYFADVDGLASAANASPAGFELHAGGRRIVGATAGLANRPAQWFVLAEASSREMSAPATRLRLTLVAIFAIMGALGLVVTWFTVGRLSGPARRLEDGARRIGEGELAHRIDVDTGDELGRVAAAFNAMASRLAESYGTLEQKVIERTADLQDRERKLAALGEMSMRLVRERTPEAVAQETEDDALRLLGADRAEVRLGPGGDEDADSLDFHPPEGPRTLVAPIEAFGRRSGILLLERSAAGAEFTSDERELGLALARHVAAALDNARLHAGERATVDALEALNRAKSDFVATVSHQLRSPIAALHGYAEILREHGDRLPSAQRSSVIAQIARQGELVNELVQDVLQVSRLESYALPFAQRPCTLDQVLKDAAAEAGGDGRVQLLGPPAPVLIEADPGLLKEAVRNTIENALRYSPAGSPVELRWLCGPDGAAQVLVEDRGPGIPEEERERVFDRFVRGGSAQVPGTGLGLSIARSILDLHGGTIALRDRPGGGLQVAISLPPRGDEP